MVWSITVFAFYLFICSYLLRRFIPDKSFAVYGLVAFWVKIIFGCLYGYYYTRNLATADTWHFFGNGLKELTVLKKDPLRFFNSSNPFQIKPNSDLNIFSDESFINSFRYVLMDKISALFSLFSGGRYYVNLIFFNWIVFWGGYYLLKFMAAFNSRYALVFYLLIFYFPPFVFWTSGFHRDGLCFTALAIALYFFAALIG